MTEMQPRSPTVSVIIPTYNRAHLVGRAIRSVLAQTFQDFEIIVVDDGSSDNTEKVVRQFNDARIRFLRHETNRGGCAARNTGINAATGEYLAFLDSDDEWLPEKLERQVSVLKHASLEQSGVHVVVTGFQRYDERSARVTTVYCPNHQGDVWSAVFKRELIGQMTSLVDREAFAAAGWYEEGLPAAQDWDMMVRLAKNSWFASIPEPLYVFHDYEGERVRSNYDNVVRAYVRLFAKYALEFSHYPKYEGRLRAYLSYLHLSHEATHEAQREAWRAIRLDPFQLKAYLYLCLSLSGHHAYRFAHALRRIRRGWRWLVKRHSGSAIGEKD